MQPTLKLTLGSLAEIEDIVDRARLLGRRRLLDPEAFRVLRALGIASPTSLFLSPDGSLEASGLAAFRGDRLVLEAVATGLTHKSDAGGVREVAPSLDAIRAVMAEMKKRFEDTHLHGWLLQDWIEHDQGLGGELLASIRWLEEGGLPTFRKVDRAVRLLGTWAQWKQENGKNSEPASRVDESREV